ncbi:MAG TPA: protein kinase [Nannocystis sp.]|jgi:serine/threonine protein kinase
MRVAAKYRRLAAIGHGGMADVHLAVACGPGDFRKLLVLKELRPGLAQDPEMQAMFRQEARIAGRMAHPNVVQTHEIGNDDSCAGGGRPFIAMEFLDGQSLQRILRRVRRDTGAGLPLPLHLRVLVELLAGLHHAHELCDYDGRPFGLVHRDVTPHNVIVTHDGQVKLIDFGIARSLDGGADTQVGTFKGKASYCAPEQARGEPVDRRADLFAVGVMLWEALTQRRMWPGLDEVAIVQRLRIGEVPALPDGPYSGLRALCRRTLAHDPAARPATAAELAEAIEQHAPGPRATQRQLAAIVSEHFAAERADLRALVEAQMRRPRERDPDAPALEISLFTTGNDNGPGALPGRVVDDPTRPDGLAARPRVTVPSGTSDEREEATESSPSRRIEPPRTYGGGRRAVAAAFVALGLGAAGLSAQVYSDRSQGAGPKGQVCDATNGPEVELSGEIEGDARLTCDKRYRLSFLTFVRPGATLTIDPGTTIVGDLATRGALVVQPGARLIAEGTAERPIVFTSAAPEGQRQAGDWGGLLLLGRAPINLQDAHGRSIRGRVEGIADGGEYGGDDPNDSSGVLRHVRIEYSGVALGPNNEINGLTLAGVGRGTRVDHVQVRHSADDCFEFFGGTVDASHLLCQDPGDDGFDWDLGYTGRLQFLLMRSAGGHGGHGLEGDNDPSGSDHAPVSAPQIYNATLCGGDSRGHGLLLRHRSQATVGNAIFAGFAGGLEVRDGGSLRLPGGPVVGAGELAAGPTVVDAALVGCDGASVVSTAGAVAPPDDGFFDASASFHGAVRDGQDAWARAAWTRWD